ncbi:MFS transporter [Paractinoplanes ferrugineus]|uniref:MFS transporter n=1 Tax=Paractinoplanes ferrugineus TaxID=113564 RepID=A0A919IXM7_9ACTN|nr:MFS transporter [Actinoplanes ferrugineus]
MSILGDQVWYVALSWSAVRIASPSAAGAILAVSAVPRLAFLLFGGAIVDRHDSRRLMIGSDLLRCVVALAAAAVAGWGPSIALLVAVALVFGAADAIFLPAAATVPPRLLPPAQLSRGAAINSLAARLALTLGAPLGGVLVAVGGLPVACVVNAATFLLSVLALRGLPPMRTARPVREPVTGALRSGLRYLRRHRLLRTILMVSLLTNLGFVGPMNIGLALVSDERGWGSAGIGVLLAGFGGGAVVASLAMVRVRWRGRVGVAMAAGIAVQGAAVSAVAVAGQQWAAVSATVVVGLTSGLVAVLTSALTQARTDDAFRGRVGSVSSFANLGITPIAMAVMGVAADRFGTTPAFAGSAALELAAAALCLAVADLRNARLPQS